MAKQIISGNLVNVLQEKISPVQLETENGVISKIEPIKQAPGNSRFPFILPGFIDAHVHIESSMLVPAEFARLAVVHGTVATISDPHEIANVCGVPGVEFMINNGKLVPFKFYFGAPSCVPATNFETAGAVLNSDSVKDLLRRSEIKYLSEMMNFPGALHGDEEVMKKIESAHKFHKPVDGHAPGLRGEQAKKYINLGISTDHECFTREEALEKLQYGMKIIIREGSAAKNFDALIELLQDYPEMIMFCSDDKHPDSLVEGHINQLCARAINKGINLFKVLRAATVNPVLHYRLDVGLLNVGDPADFILVEDLVSFRVKQTYINGMRVANEGNSEIQSKNSNNLKNEVTDIPNKIPNNFGISKKEPGDFEYSIKDFPIGESEQQNHTRGIPVIEALDGQLITNKIFLQPKIEKGYLVSDVSNDLLKMVVVNRYFEAPVAKSFVRNFGLKQGAIASSVAHDSHNIIAVGTDDETICRAVNMIIEHRGGVSCVKEDLEMVLPLPVAGLMSMNDGYEVADLYSIIDKAAKEAGSTLSSPFMTLSFMALLVIPHFKLSDKGLFDADKFAFI